ncbi:MAG TPA: HEAT repeat domain-containing protein [Thermoguttaceae bacterium]|nr:HEAT repeat domain-containing protein [Thermoguttaceae bacterium]HUT91853.1 HEAT repeat domain-containing protein [Thermoguttaceae bacterium]
MSRKTNTPDKGAWSGPVDAGGSSAPGSTTVRSRGPRKLICSLLGLIAFLVALIVVVIAAREIRKRLIQEDAAAEPTTAKQWIDQLRDGPDDDARREAAGALLREGPEAVIAALDATTVISSEATAPRFEPPEVVPAMASHGAEAVEALCQALASKKQNVRAAAARILEEIGHEAKAAVGPLSEALADESRWVRRYALEAIIRIGPDAAEAVDALLPLVEHEDRFTRRRAIEALGQIGPPARAAAPRLAKAAEADEDPTTRQAAKVALYQVNLAAIAEEAAAVAPDHVRDLIAGLRSDDEHQSVAAANDLAGLGTEAVAAVPALAVALGHQSKWLREAAAKALGTMGRDAEVVLFALNKAAEDEAPEVRTAAEEAIGKIAGKNRP